MIGHPASIPPEGRHRYAVRVYYEDTDAGGIVYHATYLRYAERARTEALRDLGVPHAELVRQCNLMFVVRRIEVDYLRAARLDDSLVVETEVLVAGAASATLRQTVRGVTGACAVLTVRLACVRLRPVPADVESGKLGATERGPEGLRPGELRPEGLRPGELRPEGLRPEEPSPGELGPGELRPEGLGPEALRPGELAPGEPGPGGNKPGRLPPRWRTVLQAMRDARPVETATGAAGGGAGIGGSGGSSS
jgi:acyl-CoA thioester hydrolase